ncbi:MAG: hypothetical protein M3R36_03210 [Bacteroidota bacterium]|nr:hypothetical protein [Bacteroidota bacterium]
MKNLIFLTLLVVCSCTNQTHNILLPDLSQANNVKLIFKTNFDSTGKIILKNIDIKDRHSVETIKTVISSKPFFYQYCISTGSMTFFKDSLKIIQMVFNTTPDFRHIAYNYNNKLVAVALSEENAKLLESFKN